MHGEKKISLTDIHLARDRIRDQIVRSPTVLSPSLTQHMGSDIYLKLDQLQVTGSFKLRGATNAMMCLSDKEKQCGVVCVSTGNHGRGMAYAAKQNGVKAIVCMGNLVPQNKIDGIKALGAEVRIVGASQDEAQIEVDRLVLEEGMTMLPPFDHPDVIAGQGTIALEIIEDVPDVETVLVPLSGGGLMAGIACGIKAHNPQARVIGLTMEKGAAMAMSLKEGKPVEVKEEASLADALGGGIGLDNEYTFNMVRDLVDETILISEREIADAIRHAYEKEQQVIEGSGSVGIAALLSGKVDNPGRTVIVVSGRNIDMPLHHEIINGSNPNS